MVTTESTFVVSVPVRGVSIRPEHFQRKEIERRPWVILGSDQFPELCRNTTSDSLLGNLHQIWDRLAPTSLLLVRYGSGERKSVWDEQRAEQVLAAINLLFLLTVDLTGGRERASPRPVFRARYREYCDLPLAFGLTGVRSVGHTGRLGLLAGDDPLQLTLRGVDDMVVSGPTIIRQVLNGDLLGPREGRLRSGMVGILGAFDTLTTGAFVAHLTGVAEALVDAQANSDDGKASWKRRADRIKVLVGNEHATAVDRVLRCRHEYVHSSQQPANDVLAFVALAVAVQVWGGLAKLYDQFADHGDLERLLDGAAIGNRATPPVADAFTDVIDAIPTGPKHERLWIQAWLQCGSA